MPAHSMNDQVIATGGRLVWVLNRDHQEYREDYNGTMIVVPPNNEKKVKMPFLDARKFLARGKAPAQYQPDGRRLVGPKSLYTEEIPEELEKEDRKLRGLPDTHKCMICNEEFDKAKALNMHVIRRHPDAEPGSKAIE